MAEFLATLRGFIGKKEYSGDQEVLLRAGRGGQLITSKLYPDFYQLAKDGRIHHYATPDEGIAPGTDVAGTAALLVIGNLSTSNEDVSIIDARLVYESGTLGAGPVYWVRAPNVSDTFPTGTDLLYTPGYMNSNGRPGNIRAVYTATVGATDPVIWRMFAGLDASLATTAGIGPTVVHDPVDGKLVIAPGWWVAVMGDAAAGTTPLVGVSVTVCTTPL